MENFTENTLESTMENAKPVRNREIRLSELTAYVQEGKKKEDIMEIYGLKSAQVTKLMQEAGLTFRKFHKPAFTLIRDVEVELEENFIDDNIFGNEEDTSGDWK